MANAQASSSANQDPKQAATQQDPTQLASEKTRKEIEKLNLEIDALNQNQRPLQKIATSATAISTMLAVVGAVIGVVISSFALYIQGSSSAEDRRHNEREEIVSIIEKLTDEKAKVPRRMGLVWALRQYWWGDNSEALSNALGTIILYDEDLNVIQAAGLAFGRISHNNPNWQKTKRVLFGSAAEGDKGTILRFDLALQDHPPQPSLQDARFRALGDAVRLSWADLSDVNLALANLKNCELYLANLRGADLSWAHLEGADLRGAHLEGANLFHSYLHGAKLKGAHLDGANVLNAIDLETQTNEKKGIPYDGKTVKEDLGDWLLSKGMKPEVIDKIRTERELATGNQMP